MPTAQVIEVKGRLNGPLSDDKRVDTSKEGHSRKPRSQSSGLAENGEPAEHSLSLTRFNFLAERLILEIGF
jgi:hypothetical protein